MKRKRDRERKIERKIVLIGSIIELRKSFVLQYLRF